MVPCWNRLKSNVPHASRFSLTRHGTYRGPAGPRAGPCVQQHAFMSSSMPCVQHHAAVPLQAHARAHVVQTHARAHVVQAHACCVGPRRSICCADPRQSICCADPRQSICCEDPRRSACCVVHAHTRAHVLLCPEGPKFFLDASGCTTRHDMCTRCAHDVGAAAHAAPCQTALLCDRCRLASQCDPLCS